jgi:predicted RNase H-like nuclease (RuvC/YqgF family)
MSNSSGTMALHFRYRLWIAEMNSHINIMRIFDDYIAELSSKKNEAAVKSGIESYQKEFINLRKEIDELKHEMHLAKMDLAAFSRQAKKDDLISFSKKIHSDMKKRYLTYRKGFEKIKKDFGQFEAKWLV